MAGLAATNRFVNWTNVVWTPRGGTSVTLTGVTNVQIKPNGSVIKFSGDGDRYNTTLANDFADPEVTVTLANLTALSAIPIGQIGTLTATHNDANNANASGGGAIVYTLANAMVGDKDVGGQHRQFGSGSLMLASYSADGFTNPISTSAA